jgi:dTDP-4-amino-4,6-dideoxygalactose transaminase
VAEIAGRRGVGVVEDAAQAPGATAQGKPAGTWGDVGTLSFGGSKLLTAGRGGALLFRDAEVFQRAKVALHRGVQAWAALSELQAAVLRPQLAKLRDATARRLANARRIVECTPLAPRADTSAAALTPLAVCDGTARGASGVHSEPAFYKLGFRYDPAAFGLPRDTFVKAMRAEGVAFDAGFKALHAGRSPSRFHAAGDLANATAAGERCVVLHHPVLSGTAADAEQVAAAVAKIYRCRGLF